MSRPPIPPIVPDRPPDPAGAVFERGMVLMVAAMLAAPAMDAIAKWLSASLSPGVIACARFAFQGVFIAPLLIAGGRTLGPRLALQALRGVLMAAAILCFFAALQVMPIADCIAIFFVEPLILTLFSALFLGESVGWRRLVAVLVGFAGALVVIQPSYAVFGPEALFPLATALGFATYMVLTRRLVADGDPLALQFTAALFGSGVLALALVFGWSADIAVLRPSWPTPGEWAILAGLGALAAAIHLTIVHAVRLTPAGVLAPFQYLEIIGATALGYALFGDFPGPWVWAGIALIVGSGLYVFHRERITART